MGKKNRRPGMPVQPKSVEGAKAAPPPPPPQAEEDLLDELGEESEESEESQVPEKPVVPPPVITPRGFDWGHDAPEVPPDAHPPADAVRAARAAVCVPLPTRDDLCASIAKGLAMTYRGAPALALQSMTETAIMRAEMDVLFEALGTPEDLPRPTAEELEGGRLSALTKVKEVLERKLSADIHTRVKL